MCVSVDRVSWGGVVFGWMGGWCLCGGGGWVGWCLYVCVVFVWGGGWVYVRAGDVCVCVGMSFVCEDVRCCALFLDLIPLRLGIPLMLRI